VLLNYLTGLLPIFKIPASLQRAKQPQKLLSGSAGLMTRKRNFKTAGTEILNKTQLDKPLDSGSIGVSWKSGKKHVQSGRPLQAAGKSGAGA
jgi:hypothetical protein